MFSAPPRAWGRLSAKEKVRECTTNSEGKTKLKVLTFSVSKLLVNCAVLNDKSDKVTSDS